MNGHADDIISLSLNKNDLKDKDLSQVRINFDKKQPQNKPNFFSYGFRLYNGISIKGQQISDNLILNFLWQFGLSKQIPIFPILLDTGLTFHFYPSPLAYPPQKPWPFKFNNLNFELVVGSQCIDFRVLTDNKEVADEALVKLLTLFYDEHMKKVPTSIVGTVKLFRTVDTPYVQWVHMASVTRKWDTIYLDENVKKEAFERINFFISSKEKYDEYCVPWKFVTLLEGIPGTGKTSLVSALACMFNRDIYILTITTKMTSIDLQTQLSRVNNGFVLIEDVDSLFVQRETKTNLDFSSFINCLDGLSTKSGSCIFLTTNHVEKLDEALIREGRVDHRISFGLPSQNSLRMMLKKLGSLWEKDHETFLEAIKDKKITIPKLQRYLFDHWRLKKTNILDDVDKL